MLQNVSSSNNAPAGHYSADNNEPLIPVPVLLIGESVIVKVLPNLQVCIVLLLL